MERVVGRAVLVAALVVAGCHGGRSTTASPPSKSAGPPPVAGPPSKPAGPPPVAEPAVAEPARCYPYLRAADGSCPTSCGTRADCAGSHGPGDFAENGWPLDCINRACVPLPPEYVNGSRD